MKDDYSSIKKGSNPSARYTWKRNSNSQSAASAAAAAGTGGVKEPPHKKTAAPKATATKRLTFVSTRGTNSTTNDKSSEFQTLDPTKADQSRKIQQRRKMIMYGKNTLGYAEYLKQVPKEKRRMFSMETPMTPNHTLDIPNKRWLGQVRAWRRALHKFDPPDADSSSSIRPMAMEIEVEEKAPVTPAKKTSQDHELARAKAEGLPVDLSHTTAAAGTPNASVGTDESVSPTSVMILPQNHATQKMVPSSSGSVAAAAEMDDWDEDAAQDVDFLCDDSDDDLL